MSDDFGWLSVATGERCREPPTLSSTAVERTPVRSGAAPPWRQVRATGGLLGVLGGEAWRGGRAGFEPGGPVSAALVDVSQAYVSDPEGGAPIRVAKQHEGVPGPGWLLPVAFVCSDSGGRAREVNELAEAAGMGSYQIPACIAYVELAASLFAAQSPEQASRDAGSQTAPAASPAPRLLGVGAVDGLAAGSWALSRPGSLAVVIPSLMASSDNLLAPWVAAAAAGLVGVRDGSAAVPTQWHRRLPRRQRQACARLAEALVDRRRNDTPAPSLVG